MINCKFRSNERIRYSRYKNRSTVGVLINAESVDASPNLNQKPLLFSERKS
jgi:hypothetical protein